MNNLFSGWRLEGASIVVCTVVALMLVWLPPAKARKEYVARFSAMLLLVLCLFSPLQVLATQFLFSAHMLVHVLLLLVIGPLLTSGLAPSCSRFQNFWNSRPLLCWAVGLGVMWFWHLPVVFNALMEHRAEGTFVNWRSVTESLSLLGGGMIFSLPVFSGQPESRLPYLNKVLYLFAACIGCSVLGLIITFAPEGLYHHFLRGKEALGWKGPIVRQWHLAPETDQQIAGLIMWVPCCLLYVAASLYLVGKWLSGKEEVPG